jgi:hypothetical protein
MIRLRRFAALLALAATGPCVGQQAVDGYSAPQHLADWPAMASGRTDREVNAQLALGPQLERNRSPDWLLAEQRRLDRALAGLQPQRKGVVDAYVVSIGLDSDPIFGREAREAGRVLSRRYDAAGRTIVLAGTDGSGPSALPNGSPATLAIALARIAELMDKDEDVLVLYTAGHGAPVGLAYHDADQGYGLIGPQRLARMLSELEIRNRLLILSACYSGIFVPAVASERTALFTAASADRTSFGCAADRDWTFFGDAMINQALRKPQPLAAAGAEATKLIGQWEAQGKVTPSRPQTSIGRDVAAWLAPLEARMPRAATQPVGRPAISILAELKN